MRPIDTSIKLARTEQLFRIILRTKRAFGNLAHLVHGSMLMSALVRSRSFSEFGGGDDQEQCRKNNLDL